MNYVFFYKGVCFRLNARTWHYGITILLLVGNVTNVSNRKLSFCTFSLRNLGPTGHHGVIFGMC